MTEAELMKRDEPLTDFDKFIFLEKYAMKDNIDVVLEHEVSQAFRRVAKALAAGFIKNIKEHPEGLEKWSEVVLEQEFYDCMAERRGIPAGRSLLALGNTEAKITALNCFVVPVDDSIESIYENEKNAAIIQQRGGGFGTNFSKLRPKGAFVKGVKSTASGPVSFMKSWDAMIETMKSAGNRRGAGIAIIDVNHPDILEFIACKRNKDLTNFNVSVGITNDFVNALKTDGEYELKHSGISYGKVKAKSVFDKFVENAYNYNEPGILFKDRVNELNNSYYYQKIESTNPCGEIPLPDWGCCCLGMIVLPTFVKNPFVNKEIDIDKLKSTVKTMVYMLDTVLDITNYPLKENEKVALQDRRIGLGITGLGDMFAMLKIKYDSDEAIAMADVMMETIRNAAYEASVELARLKSPFPKFNREKYLLGKFIQQLPEKIRDDIATYGIRNVSILTCQPAGTVSLLLNNVSSGIEPIIFLKQKRKIRDQEGDLSKNLELLDYAYKYFIAHGFNKVYSNKPDFFQTSKDVSLTGHLKMQNTIQKYVDNSISKTINFPEATSLEDFKKFMFDVITGSYYIKGMTTYREGTIAAVITDIEDIPETKADKYRKKSFSYQIKRSSGLPSAYIHITYHKNQISQVFIDSRDIDFYKSMLPYTRLLSIMFTKEKNLEGLLELLQELEDMDWVEMEETFSFKDRQYHNILAAIKECIWDALVELGLVKTEEEVDDEDVIDNTECPNCKAKNSLVKDGKCNICNVCGQSMGVCEI